MTHRSSYFLAWLTIVGLQSYSPIEPQAMALSSVCRPDQSLEIRFVDLAEQARVSLDKAEGTTAFRFLQAALAIAPQVTYPRTLIEQWLLEDNNGIRFAQLSRLIEPKQSVQILNQLLQITQRLGSTDNEFKIRALATIGRQAALLNQPESASTALEQALKSVQAKTPVDSLLDIAAGYTALAQPQIAQMVLTNAEKKIQRLPQADRFTPSARLAALYAQAGNLTKAKEIAAKLPVRSELQSIAQREIAQSYIAAKQLNEADRIIQSIANPAQKAIALGKIAVAYDLAKQPNPAQARFRQAVQAAKTPNLVSSFFSSELLLSAIVDNYLEVGRRDDARQLAQSMSFLQKQAFKAIVLADVQAKQPEKARQLLTQQLIKIQDTQDDWQRFERSDLVETAVKAQQFEWISQEWARISKIDFGLMDHEVEKIVNAYAQNGQQVQALKWVEQLPIANRPLLQIRLKSAIALIAHQSGQTAWARNLLQTTEQEISALIKASREKLQREGGDVSEPDDIEYIGVGLIALSYAQSGDAKTTKKLLDRVVQSRANQNDLQLGGRVDSPFDLFREANQVDGALQLAIGSAFPEKREQRLQTVASMALTQNRFEIPVAVVPRLTAASRKTQLLLAIAQRYTQLKQFNQSLPFLAEAFKVAQTIPGDESQVDRLGADGGTVIEMENDRGSLIEAIAIEYARLKQPAQALKVANTLKEKKTRDQALEKIKCTSGLALMI